MAANRIRGGLGLQAALTAFGILQLVASCLLRDHSAWFSNVLTNTGTATLLFVFFYHAQRTLENRVEGVRQQAKNDAAVLAQEIADVRVEARQGIDDLRNGVRARLEAADREAMETYRAVGVEPSRDTVIRAFARAADRNLLSVHGPRVRAVNPELDIFARFLAQGTAVSIQLEMAHGQVIDTLDWRDEEPTEEFTVRLGDLLQRSALRPSVGDFDPMLMFVELSHLMVLADRLIAQRAIVDNVTGIEQYFAPQWILTDTQLDTTLGNPPYQILLTRLKEMDWIDHVLDKTWVDRESFLNAFHTARALSESRNSCPIRESV